MAAREEDDAVAASACAVGDELEADLDAMSSSDGCLCCSAKEEVVSPICFVLTAVVLCSLLGGVFVTGARGTHPWAGVLLLLAVLPSLLILYLLYWRRDRESAPVYFVNCLFFCGMLGALPVALMEALLSAVLLPVDADHQRGSVNVPRRLLIAFLLSFVIAGLTEELFKYILTWRRTADSKSRLTPYGVVVVSIAGALGFATLENTAYVFSPATAPEAAFTVALLRGILAVPFHSTTGALIGVGIAQRIYHDPSLSMMSILALPITLHGLYDFLLVAPASIQEPLFIGLGFAAAVMVLVVGLAVAVARVRALTAGSYAALGKGSRLGYGTADEHV